MKAFFCKIGVFEHTVSFGECALCLFPLQDCIICMEKLSMVSGYSDVTDSKTIGPVAVGCLIKCSHSFHLLCLLAMYCNGNKVPTCWPGWGPGVACLVMCIWAGDSSCPVRDPGCARRQPLPCSRMRVGMWGDGSGG